MCPSKCSPFLPQYPTRTVQLVRTPPESRLQTLPICFPIENLFFGILISKSENSAPFIYYFLNTQETHQLQWPSSSLFQATNSSSTAVLFNDVISVPILSKGLCVFPTLRCAHEIVTGRNPPQGNVLELIIITLQTVKRPNETLINDCIWQ
jgi:hypothetical protein